jgi:hypothetical protein
VQALKRHRDLFFKEDLKAAPPSILITTLAAHAYKGEQNLYEAVAMMAATMPNHIQRDGRGWCVPNPVQPEENFADKWLAHPERRENFVRWISALTQDLEETRQLRGIPVVSERLAKSFGSEVMRSAERLGGRYLETREAGALTMATGSGLLSTETTGTRKVREHGFYGAEDPTQ